MTYELIEKNHPGWEESFIIPNDRFKQYIGQKQRKYAGTSSETIKIAIEIFDFLKKRYIEAPPFAPCGELGNTTFKISPIEVVLARASNNNNNPIIDTYGNDPETYGYVRPSDIVKAIMPPNPRKGSDSPNAKKYPNKNKTIIYRILSEMRELNLIKRHQINRKKVYYQIVISSSAGHDIDRTKKELLREYYRMDYLFFESHDKYQAAIEIMNRYEIPSPEKQIKELIEKEGDRYAIHKIVRDNHQKQYKSMYKENLFPEHSEK